VPSKTIPNYPKWVYCPHPWVNGWVTSSLVETYTFSTSDIATQSLRDKEYKAGNPSFPLRLLYSPGLKIIIYPV
jgi:hypothetical protein